MDQRGTAASTKPKAVPKKGGPPPAAPAPAAAAAGAAVLDGWTEGELAQVAERAAAVAVAWDKLSDDDLMDVLDVFEGKDEDELRAKWDAALVGDEEERPAGALSLVAAAKESEAPQRTDSAAALEELEAMSPMMTPQTAPAPTLAPAPAPAPEPARSQECLGYDGKYEGEPEQQMVAWIREVTDTDLAGGWMAGLKDGERVVIGEASADEHAPLSDVV
jgi:hypothetical protein